MNALQASLQREARLESHASRPESPPAHVAVACYRYADRVSSLNRSQEGGV